LALDWAREVGAVEVELRLATALRAFWNTRGPIAEGLRRLEEAVRRAGDRLPERRFEALRYAALSALHIGELEIAERLAGEALTLARELGDTSGAVSALIKLAHAAGASGQPQRAWSLMEEAVATAQQFGDPETLARALLNLGDLAASERDFARAAALSEQSIHEGGKALDAEVKATALFNLAFARVKLGEAGRGEGPLREALELALELGDNHLVAACLEEFAAVEAARDARRAATLLGAAHALMEEVGVEADPETSAEVRAAAGEDTHEDAYAEGRGLPLDDALAYALRYSAERPSWAYDELPGALS
jgi:non-specific serine/threonine protein kinase